MKNGPQKLLIIGPDPFISQSSPEHSPELIFHIMKSLNQTSVLLSMGQSHLTVNQVITVVPNVPQNKNLNHICHWPPTEAKFNFKPNFKSRIKRLFTLGKLLQLWPQRNAFGVVFFNTATIYLFKLWQLCQ